MAALILGLNPYFLRKPLKISLKEGCLDSWLKSTENFFKRKTFLFSEKSPIFNL
jgi:hypothetical protein